MLQGLAEEDWKKIRQVVLEAHDESEGRGALAEIVGLLQSHGYDVVTEQDTLLRGTDRWNVYAVRRAEGNGTRINGAGRSSGASVRLRSNGNGAVRNGEERVELSGPDLRRHLERLLPEHMIPSAFVRLEAIPLTPSGKVDRRALAKYKAISLSDPQAVSLQTPTEEMIASIWSELLKRQSVSREDNFFELGGHSLLATQVISHVREMFGVEVELRRLFEQPTVREFSRSIEAALRAGEGVTVPALQRAEREEREQLGGMLPLSFAQQRLWFLDQLEPGSASYNVPMSVRLKGGLNVAALERDAERDRATA